MKQDIHPRYEMTNFSCACGNTLNVASTLGGDKHLEICNQCHPFFKGDGSNRLLDTAGRIEKFKRRYKKN